jgi:plasmid stabilization system protein ParE
MADVRWTAEAQQWLEDIFEYIAQNNPQAASRVVQAIYERAQDLIAFPQLGYRYAASSRHIRILLHEQY